MDTTPSRAGLCHGLLALLLFAPLVDGGTTYVPATVIRLGALALVAAWLHAALGPGGAWRRGTPVDLPVLLFVVLAGGSTVASPYPYQSLQAFLSLATAALVLAVAADIARDRGVARRLAGAVALGGVVQAALALWQRASTGDRAAGTYFNPNHLALALAMTLATLLAWRPTGRLREAARWALCAAVAAAILATGSRGGVLAAAAGAGLVGWLRWRWRAVGVAVAAALFVALVPNPLAARLEHARGRDPLLYARVQIWRSALERAADHPLGGVGLNMFRHSARRYAFPVEGELSRYGRRASSAHNDYLEILAELGAPGFGLAAWALLALAARGRRLLRRGPGERDAGEGWPVVAAAGALTAVATQAAVDTPLGVPGLLVQAAVLAGVVLGAPVPGEVREAAAPRVPGWLAVRPRVTRAAVLAALLVAALGVTRHAAAYLAGGEAAAARDAGDLPRARVWLERAAALAPGSAGYPDALAAASVQLWRRTHDAGDALIAERMMLRAMRLDAEDAARYARLAEVYREITPADPTVRRRALLRAQAMYEQAERLDPYAVAFPYEKAGVLLLLGDAERAVAALRRAVALEPNFLPARLRLARLLVERRQRDAARAEYAAIETTLAAYDAARARSGEVAFARTYLAVDPAVVRREAAALAEGRR